jgi:hypothetical protein
MRINPRKETYSSKNMEGKTRKYSANDVALHI